MLNKIQETKKFISEKADFKPDIGLILGSGLGSLADEVKHPVIIDYNDIPHFPVSTVEGHAGQIVMGDLQGKKVIIMKGRFHYYEGYSMKEVVFPVRVMQALGIRLLIITNACGGLNHDFYPGTFMVIRDHINLTGGNPLTGFNYEELGPRFPDMSDVYTKELIALAHKAGKALSIDTKEGVYAGISGPYYYSKAELKMLIKMGADALGMSTVPEVIAAGHGGTKLLGISCITDMAIPHSLESISHQQVMEAANKIKPKFIALVKGILNEVKLS